MRVLAVHDSQGSIVAILAGPAGPHRFGVALEPWQQVHEVDVPGLSLDADDAELHRILSNARANYRVELATDAPDVSTGQLVPK